MWNICGDTNIGGAKDPKRIKIFYLPRVIPIANGRNSGIKQKKAIPVCGNFFSSALFAIPSFQLR